jgi:predicted amidohydrolase YtcJ
MHEGRLLAFDDEAERAAAAQAGVSAIDLPAGRVVLPAFIDCHLHLLGAAARLLAVDCGPDAVFSIEELQDALRRRGAETPSGEWIRAAGYDETYLVERRHPNRRDLDAAAPDHPVLLLHRTGHACVLNSLALRLAGIDGSTPEPPGGYMERDLEAGEPTGFFIEMKDVVEGSLPALPYEDLAGAIDSLDAELLAAGVAFVQDATSTNGPGEWALLERLMREGRLSVGVSMMTSLEGVDSIRQGGLRGRLRRAGVKLAPRELEHEVQPGSHELSRSLAKIAGSGRQAAVHAVGRHAVQSTLDAYAAIPSRSPPHRIEHASVCDDDLVRRIRGLGLAVVTQPGFVYWNGDAYLERVADVDLPHLYPLRALLDAGVLVAGSSDAPVSPPDVLTAVRAAVERRSRAGRPVSAHQGVSGREAVEMYTRGAAAVLGLERERGRLASGLAADLVVLSQDPLAHPASLDGTRVEATFIGGVLVYERGRGRIRKRGADLQV